MNITLSKSYGLWAIASLFYLYQFVLRLSPSVMMEDLMQAFSIDATGFAALGSIALASYSFFQIPLGAFADIYGIRRCILLFLSLCIFGTFVFSISAELWIAQAGRFIIGLGSAAAFLSVSKTISLYFPIHKKSTLFGLTMVVGTLGALNGGIPLCYLVKLIGWRHALLFMCALGVLIFSVIYLFLIEPKAEKVETHVKSSSLSSLRQILKNRECWIFAGTAIGLFIAICVLGDLWGVSFVMKTHHVERSLAVQVVSFMYVGLCIGSLTITWYSDLIRKSKVLITSSTLMLIMLLSLILSPIPLPFESFYILFFLIGFFSGAEMLCFSGICKSLPSSAAGITTGFLNGMVMMGGAFIQQCVGFSLDFLWRGEFTEDGIRLYLLGDYRISLSLILPVLILAFCSSLFIKEKAENYQTI